MPILFKLLVAVNPIDLPKDHCCKARFAADIVRNGLRDILRVFHAFGFLLHFRVFFILL